jgi:transposase
MFVGIDIGKYRHQAAFLDNSGKDLCASIPFDNTEEGFSLFFKTLDSVCDGTVVVGMEATGHYWLNLYCALLARDIETHVINPIQTDAVRRMNIRKTKTDSVDCRYVALVIRMGDYSDVAVQDYRHCRTAAALPIPLRPYRQRIVPEESDHGYSGPYFP